MREEGGEKQGKDRMGGSGGREPMHAMKIKQPSWAIQLAGDDAVWLCLSFPSGLRQEGLQSRELAHS